MSKFILLKVIIKESVIEDIEEIAEMLKDELYTENNQEFNPVMDVFWEIKDTEAEMGPW